MPPNFNKSVHTIFTLSVLVLSIFVINHSIKRQNNLKISLGILAGDVNNDGSVNVLDFQLLSNSFGKSSADPGFNSRADFNHDNSINVLDFQILSNNFGANSDPQNTPTSIPTVPTSPPNPGNGYYVSLSGNDSNSGSSSHPFKTFSKAMSVLRPGNTLFIFGGTYTEKLTVTKSGTSVSPIIVKPVSGQRVIIDAANQSNTPISVPAGISYVTIEGLEVTRSTFDGVLVEGSNVVINQVDSYNNKKFGYRIKGRNVTIENSKCRDNVTENTGGGNTSGGWGACLRTSPGSSDVTIRNNHVYNNWGEGIIVGQADGAKVYGNLVHDNYSVNIYIGNSYDIDVYKNMTYSTNSRYFRAGRPANCITASEELISDNWGAQLHNIRVFNNIAYSCKTGVGYTYAEVSGNGCQNCLFAYNTLVDTEGIRVIPGTKNSVTIKNNIIDGGSVNAPTNSTISNNLTTDPRFATAPSTNPNSFKLSSSSPAINFASVLTGITDDYEGKARTSNPDAGAFEF